MGTRPLLSAASELFTPSRPRRTIAVLWLSLIAAAAAVLFFFDPSKSSLFPPCPFRALTGLLCPGCGSTRALHELVHGRLITALKLSPLLAVYAPILGYALLSTVALALRGKPLPQPRIRAGWIWLLLVVNIVIFIGMDLFVDFRMHGSYFNLLLVFTLVNLSLWRIKRATAQPTGVINVPVWVPVSGFFASAAFVAVQAAIDLGAT